MRLPAFILLSLLLTAMLKAQWTQLQSGSVNTLYDIQFPTPDTGYAVGYYGTILKTVDGGNNWTTLSSGTGSRMNTVCFISGSTGLVAGGSLGSDSAIILKTYDGGEHWQTLFEDHDYVINSLFFINNNKGFAAGGSFAGDIILKTTNGGDDWYPVTFDTVAVLTEIQFPVPDTGYSVYRSGVLRTVDGGDNWTVVSPPSNDILFPFSILEGCYFTDAHTGYIAGWYNGALWKTTDAGITWTNADSLGPLTYQLYDVYFPTSQTGYAVGWYGNIYKTEDAGEGWAGDTLGLANGNTIYAVYFVSEDYGFAVSDSGKIFRKGTRGTLGISPSEKSVGWKLSPNPFRESAILTFENPAGRNHTLQLFDTSGRLLREEKNITRNRIVINRKGLPSGEYLFELKVGTSQVASGKLVLE